MKSLESVQIITESISQKLGINHRAGIGVEGCKELADETEQGEQRREGLTL